MAAEGKKQRVRAPLWMWIMVCALMVVVMGYLRFITFPEQIVPLTFALPLLVCLWNRNLRLLWGMAAIFAGMSALKLGFTLPAESLTIGQRLTFMSMQLANIFIVAGVIHAVIRLTGRLEVTVAALEQSNAELEASNEELAAREEEISRQNEELQSQSEELEQQMEELNAQSEELQILNEQLAARERTLNDLLDTSSESETLERLGLAVERLLGPRACAAALLEPQGNRMAVHPLLGVEHGGAHLARERTMASLAMARDCAAFLADLALRPDLEAPRLRKPEPVRSILAAPLRSGQTLGGALEIYSSQPGEWTEHDLRVAQWLAEQCGRLWKEARLRSDLDRQRDLLRTVTENASAALFMTDAAGVCTYMNSAAEQLTGHRLSQVKGRSLHELVHASAGASPGCCGPEPCSLQSDVAGARAWDDVFIRGKGEPVPVVCIASPIMEEDRWVATVLEVRDVSEQQRIERERQMLLDSERAARSEAERAGRAKDEFVATLSHELRTPLNAVLGWATLLRKGTPEGEELAAGLEIIERNARHQSQLISELLDISRITAGKLRLDVQPVDLPLIAESALDAVRPGAAGKGIRLEKIIEPIDRIVMGDPGRLQQIIWNLLVNAIKFTPRGGSVQLVVARVASYVQITVADSGQGIEAEVLPHIFERYRQGDPSRARRHGGLGLGLAIVKSLAELHGGSIEARSDGLGKGAMFTVLLPVRAADTPDLPPHPHSHLRQDPTMGAIQAASVIPTLEDLSILVVEDEPDARELIRRILEERGAKVTTADSGAAALELLAALRPHLLISDIGMPEMDGYTLIRRIRSEPPMRSARELPAIALTAFARSEDRTMALLAGFQSHLSKPVEAAELIATVATLAAAPSFNPIQDQGSLQAPTEPQDAARASGTTR
jgi:PAS domain S-box-containing protein